MDVGTGVLVATGGVELAGAVAVDVTVDVAAGAGVRVVVGAGLGCVRANWTILAVWPLTTTTPGLKYGRLAGGTHGPAGPPHG